MDTRERHQEERQQNFTGYKSEKKNAGQSSSYIKIRRLEEKRNAAEGKEKKKVDMSSDERRKRNMYGVKTERHGRLSEFSERWNEDVERDSEEIVYSKVKERERETDFDKAREKNVEKRERKKKQDKKKYRETWTFERVLREME